MIDLDCEYILYISRKDNEIRAESRKFLVFIQIIDSTFCKK